jgi:hypothetical protein
VRGGKSLSSQERDFHYICSWDITFKYRAEQIFVIAKILRERNTDGLLREFLLYLNRNLTVVCNSEQMG